MSKGAVTPSVVNWLGYTIPGHGTQVQVHVIYSPLTQLCFCCSDLVFFVSFVPASLFGLVFVRVRKPKGSFVFSKTVRNLLSTGEANPDFCYGFLEDLSSGRGW